MNFVIHQKWKVRSKCEILYYRSRLNCRSIDSDLNVNILDLQNQNKQ